MHFKLPSYNPDNEFERQITNPSSVPNRHHWVIVFDGGTEQCSKCGCWDPTPYGMPAHSMAPEECEGIVTITQNTTFIP